MGGVADILRMTPLVCPACGERVELCVSGHVICWDCGEIWYDSDMQVWRIRKFYNAYDDGDESLRNKNQEENKV